MPAEKQARMENVDNPDVQERRSGRPTDRPTTTESRREPQMDEMTRRRERARSLRMQNRLRSLKNI
jgi:hypothetical protein